MDAKFKLIIILCSYIGALFLIAKFFGTNTCFEERDEDEKDFVNHANSINSVQESNTSCVAACAGEHACGNIHCHTCY